MGKTVGVILNKPEEVVKSPIINEYKQGIQFTTNSRTNCSNDFALDESKARNRGLDVLINEDYVL